MTNLAPINQPPAANVAQDDDVQGAGGGAGENQQSPLPASNRAVILLILWAMGGTTAMLIWTMSIWNSTLSPVATGVPTFNGADLSLACTLGALGGFIHCMQSLGAYLGNRQLVASWVPYYLFYPLKGACLSLIVVLIIKGGLGQGMASSDDLIKLSAIAALAGLFSNQALEMCGNVFDIVFNKVKAKDDLDDQGPRKPQTVAKTNASVPAGAAPVKGS